MKALLEQLIRWSGQTVIFPFYHLISDQAPKHTSYLFQSRSRKDFENDLKTYLNYFDPISAEDLISLLKDPIKRKEKYFLTSFDDGYREVYDHAAPILQKYQIPAIAFVNPAFVDNGQLFYRNKASILADACNLSVKKLSEDSHSHIKTHDTLRDILLSTDQNQIDFLDRLAQWSHIDFNQYLEEHNPYLSLDQIQELSRNGFSIGAHSLDHPDFLKISLDEQLHQAHESIRWVEEQIDNQPRLFAFPYSDHNISQAFFDQLDCDLSFGSGMIKKDARINHFQRLDMEKSNRHCFSFLLREFAKYYLKMMIGKHKEKSHA